MEKKMIKVYQGQLIDEENDLTLFELCEVCRTEPREIIGMIEEGIIEPGGQKKQEWRFSFQAAERVRKTVRLKRDFEINFAGVALVLQLLDRIEELESILNSYNR